MFKWILIHFEDPQILKLGDIGREKDDFVLGQGKNLGESIRMRNRVPLDQPTLKFERDPGCSGKDLILLRLRSRTSSTGIAVIY